LKKKIEKDRKAAKFLIYNFKDHI